MPHTRTQTSASNLLLQTYISAAQLATWGVGPDVKHILDVAPQNEIYSSCSGALYKNKLHAPG